MFFHLSGGGWNILMLWRVYTSQASQIQVDDDRLQMLVEIVTRVAIMFESESQVSVAIEVEGKWEVGDGGHTIIWWWDYRRILIS